MMLGLLIRETPVATLTQLPIMGVLGRDLAHDLLSDAAFTLTETRYASTCECVARGDDCECDDHNWELDDLAYDVAMTASIGRTDWDAQAIHDAWRLTWTQPISQWRGWYRSQWDNVSPSVRCFMAHGEAW